MLSDMAFVVNVVRSCLLYVLGEVGLVLGTEPWRGVPLNGRHSTDCVPTIPPFSGHPHRAFYTT